MQYIKPERRPAMTWTIEHWMSPLASLGDSIQMWTMHSLKALNEGRAYRAYSAFWQNCDAIDIYHTRLTDMKDGKGAERLGMTEDELWELYGPVFADQIQADIVERLKVFEAAGIDERVLDAHIVSESGGVIPSNFSDEPQTQPTLKQENLLRTILNSTEPDDLR